MPLVGEANTWFATDDAVTYLQNMRGSVLFVVGGGSSGAAAAAVGVGADLSQARCCACGCFSCQSL